MCGLAGKIDFAGSVGEELLEAMCGALEHRGPDARGMHIDGGVGLGVKRLAVIDLNTGDQPIYNEDRSVVVILNGEIYNYLELREELRARGHRFRTAGDTETIVHLYEELGARCVQRLRGMFAFAVWDHSRRMLLLARDRVGKKPLFFFSSGQTLWFASEPKAIFEDPSVPREADEDAIDAFLRLQYVPHPTSAFKGLRKLPPAHVLQWSGGEPRTSRYWTLDYRANEPVAASEAASLVRDSLLEATRLRLRSDVPVGALLSGGIDSSAVVAAMARAGAARVKTFSAGFEDSNYDETDYARQVADRYGTEHHELRVGPEIIGTLPRLVWHYGEPFADSSALATFALAEFTRERVTVALNGDGGDESFAGYERYVAQMLGERLGLAPPAARRLIGSFGAAFAPLLPPRSLAARGLRVLSVAALSPGQRYDNYVSTVTRRDLQWLYTPEFSGALPTRPTADRFIVDAWLSSSAPSSVERVLDVDVHTYLPGDLLVKMDIATMAHSLEVRSPFLDHLLMERAARLSSSLKLRGRRTKALLREAVRPWLPDSVIDRPKMGFGVPIASWLRGPLADLPGDVLLDPVSRGRGIFRPEAVRALIDDHRSAARDCSPQLWALIVLELWFQTYIDGSMTGPLELATTVR